MSRPTAARAIWPYPHRTVEQVDHELARLERGEPLRNSRYEYETPLITDELRALHREQLAKELARQNRTKPEGVRAV